MGRCVRGFFKDSRHAGFHFSYLTTTPPLNENIRENLEPELGEHQTESNRLRQWLMFFQASSWSI